MPSPQNMFTLLFDQRLTFTVNNIFFNPQKEPGICDNVVGYFAVYRICFAMAVFFFFFCLIMYGVKSSKDPRSGIQNGFWGIKVLIYVGAILGAFFIPSGTFQEGIKNIELFPVISLLT